jgi:hypothetical protein
MEIVMADWKYELDLTPEYQQAHDGEIDIHTLARVVSERIAALQPKIRYRGAAETLTSLAEDFADIADGCGDEEDFDYTMNELYDWADLSLDNKAFNGKKLCWVKTF